MENISQNNQYWYQVFTNKFSLLRGDAKQSAPEILGKLFYNKINLELTNSGLRLLLLEEMKQASLKIYMYWLSDMKNDGKFCSDLMKKSFKYPLVNLCT